MELDEVFGGSSLKVSDLQGREVNLRISGYQVRDFDDGRKVELQFDGTAKVLICNKTNANSIARIHGSNLNEWVGKEITLVPSQTDFQGSQVACIRVKVSPPAVLP